MMFNNICGLGISFSLNAFKILYITICLLAWTMSLLFAPRYLSHDKHKTRFYVFSIITLVATIGVFAADDLFTLFTFFEIMSLASYVWVAQEEKPKALKAADTYMAVAVIGGLVLLMGILLLYTNIGTVRLTEIAVACEAGGKFGEGRLYAAAFCMFFGFAAKAGAFPIHIWLPKAHPVAPAPASALLSGVLTKAGIFGILIVSSTMFPEDRFWGAFVLVIGMITMVLGAILAIFSNDIKRTLACSSVSQIGFIITGIACAVFLGEESGMAKYGTLLHMVNHTLVKICVFLVAGTIYQNVHSLDLNDIRGFGRNKPFLGFCFALGGLSLAGVPGFLGYLSKTAIHEALVEAGETFGNHILAKGLEWVFLFSGGCTLCYMTKLFVCVFVERNRDEKRAELYESGSVSSGKGTDAVAISNFDSLDVHSLDRKNRGYMDFIQKVSIVIPALLVLLLGITVAIKDDYRFFVFHVMLGGFISITIGILLYTLFVRKVILRGDYQNLWPKGLDLEEKVYKPVIIKILPNAIGFAMRLIDEMTDGIVAFLRRTIYSDAKIEPEYREGTIFTHIVGHLADVFKAIVEHRPVEYDVEHKLAIKHMEGEENSSILRRSLSYGLILACLGMFLMLGFILYTVFIK